MIRTIVKKLANKILLWLDGTVLLLGKGDFHSGVALIRLDAIGDFILWLDTAKEYRRIYPNQKITLIANDVWSDFARLFPYWDDVLPVKVHSLTRNPFYRWVFLCRVHRAGFDTAIQPTFSRVLMHGDSLIRASAAKHRIGSVGNLSNITAEEKNLSDRWYTKLLPANPQRLMELERNAEFIGQLTGKPYKASLPRLPIMQALPESIKPVTEYFILFPGASQRGKQWPISAFAMLLRQLQRLYPWQPVLCGSQVEAELCAAIAEASGHDCVNLAGRTSLAELTELIRKARVLIGNDTSAVHIAAAVGTPAVCILGGGHYGRFMPYPADIDGLKPVIVTQPMECFQCNWRCSLPHDKNGPVPCISRISVEAVLAGVQKAIAVAGDGMAEDENG